MSNYFRKRILVNASLLKEGRRISYGKTYY
jgi:hypothetical protein